MRASRESRWAQRTAYDIPRTHDEFRVPMRIPRTHDDPRRPDYDPRRPDFIEVAGGLPALTGGAGGAGGGWSFVGSGTELGCGPFFFFEKSGISFFLFISWSPFRKITLRHANLGTRTPTDCFIGS